MILTFIKSALSGVYDLRVQTVCKPYDKLYTSLSALIVNGSAFMTKTYAKINQTLMQATKAGALS